ncbi:MAG: hypothetical protein ACHREM_00080 [Polyangiales bacterium]
MTQHVDVIMPYKPLRPPRISTGSREFDQVLGFTQADEGRLYGAVPGFVYLIAVRPDDDGIRLVQKVALDVSNSAMGGIYATANDKTRDFMAYACKGGCFRIVATDSMIEVEDYARKDYPHILVIDDVSSVRAPHVHGMGSPVNEAIRTLQVAQRIATDTLAAVFVVLYETNATKSLDELAGAAFLEALKPAHLADYVDGVLDFGQEGHDPWWYLSMTKNRGGSTSEVGVFQRSGRFFIDVAKDDEDDGGKDDAKAADDEAGAVSADGVDAGSASSAVDGDDDGDGEPDLRDDIENLAWSLTSAAVVGDGADTDEAMMLADEVVVGMRERRARGAARAAREVRWPRPKRATMEKRPPATGAAMAPAGAAAAPAVSEAARTAWRDGSICVLAETLAEPKLAAEIQALVEHHLGLQELTHARSLTHDGAGGAVVSDIEDVAPTPDPTTEEPTS